MKDKTPMAQLDVLERLFKQLALDLGYEISDDEIQKYLGDLQDLGLNYIGQAAVSFAAEEKTIGVFPSINEFRKRIEAIKK
jgi:hypothetical protein